MTKRIIPMLLSALLAQPASAAVDDGLFSMSLEQLMQINVTTASKRPQSYIKTPRAVYVITREDIRRAGVTSIPEALRMAPGVHVAQITSHRWAISIRGFQQELAGKLLVLIDGRSVYTPTFSGVYWDAQDLVLDNIERIEIVRGPGSVVWGSNAVNGVINIITRNAADTQGGKANIATGNDESIADVTYGDHSGDWYWRVYGKYFKRNDRSRADYQSTDLSSKSINDAWDVGRTGFRADRNGKDSSLTLSANLYSGNIDDLADAIPQTNPSGARDYYYAGDMSGFDTNLVWKKHLSKNSQWQVSLFADQSDRKDVNENEQRRSQDIELQHNLKLGAHNLTYGGGFRHYESLTQPQLALSFVPNDDTNNLFNLFAHNEWTLSDAWRINFGLKMEHDDYTNTSYQPALGASWYSDKHQAWFNVERAIQLPNRVDRDVRANVAAIPADTQYAGQPEGFAQLTGSPNVREQTIVAYELGYRTLYNKHFYWDLATYYFDYKDLIFIENRDNPGTPYINAAGEYIVPLLITNDGEGNIKGAEISFAWQASHNWKLKGAFTYTSMNLSGNPTADLINQETPEKQFNLRSYYNLNEHWQIDTAIYHVSSLKSFNNYFDHYTRLDLHLARKLGRHSELTLVGQNLLQDAHTEQGEKAFSTYAEVPRTWYVKWSQDF